MLQDVLCMTKDDLLIVIIQLKNHMPGSVITVIWTLDSALNCHFIKTPMNPASTDVLVCDI